MAKIVQVARFTADGSAVTREFDKMGQGMDKVTGRVRQGAQSMSSSLRAVDASAGVAREKMEGLAGSAGAVGTVLRSLGPVGLVAAAGIGAAALALKALHDGARNAVRDLGAIETAAQRVGVTTDTLQEVRFAVLGIGGAAEQADSALSQFAEKLGEATLTGRGGGFDVLRQLGFSAAEIANMRDIEEVLPRIADRISEMTDATEQFRAAKELGLDPLLPLLQQGEGAFDRAAQAAQRMGYVLDRDLLARARELNGEWEQASQIIDLQLKSALVELAPVFVDVANAIAQGTRELVSFIDAFRELDERSTRGLTEELEELGGRRRRIVGGLMHPDVVTAGVFGPRDDLNPAQQFRAGQLRDIIEREREIRAILREREAAPAPSPAGGGRDFGLLPEGAASEHERFVEQLREELRVRDELLAIQAESPKLTQQEAEAQFALAEQLRQLAEARAAGAIASDDELAALQRSVEANHEAAAAARANAEAMEVRNAQAEEWRALMISLETPRERMLREEADFRKLWAGQEGTETFARGIERIREEYEALAEAQFEASLAGRALAGIIDGQIRSFEDLALVLGDMGRDALVRELLSGSLFREGFGGFVSGAGDRFANSVTGGSEGLAGITGLFGGEEENGAAALNKSAKAAASSLTEGLIPSVADAAVKVLSSTVATVADTTAKSALTVSTVAEKGVKDVTTASMLKLKLAADAAAKALRSVGTSGDDSEIAAIVNIAAAFGGGLAGGGSMLVGARHGAAEFGPELAVVGGWAQVVPNQALEGMALLAKLSQGAGAATATHGTPRIAVNLRNESGVEMETTADARMGSDGSIELDLVLARTVAGQIGRGTADDQMRSRFNIRPQRLRRG